MENGEFPAGVSPLTTNHLQLTTIIPRDTDLQMINGCLHELNDRFLGTKRIYNSPADFCLKVKGYRTHKTDRQWLGRLQVIV